MRWFDLCVCAAVALFASGAIISPPAMACLDDPSSTPKPASADAPADAHPKRTPVRVLHLAITGDLDAMRTVDDLRAKLQPARERGFDLLLIDISGRVWRAEVLHALVNLLAPDARSERVVVFLRGVKSNAPKPRRTQGPHEPAPNKHSGKIVGTGQAALCLAADACYLETGTAVVFSPADERADLATDPEAQAARERELRGLLWTRLQERGKNVLLAAIAPRPTGALFAHRQDESWRLVSEKPASGESQDVVPPPGPAGDAPPVSIDAQLAVRIALCDAVAPSPTHALSMQRITARTTHRLEIRSGLSLPNQQLEAAASDIDAARQKAKAAIDAVYFLRGTESISQKRSVGKEQVPRLERAAAQLRDLELLATDYPELQRAPPPGFTPVGQTTQTISAAWRTFFQTRRTDLDFLLGRARTMASQ